MSSAIRRMLASVLCLCLCACTTVPRGGPVESELVSADVTQVAGASVYPVTRQSLSALAAWAPPPASVGPGWPARGTAGGGGLAPGDSLAITVWDNEANSLLVSPGARSATLPPTPVRADGTISVPYVGEVAVGGLDRGAAQALLQGRLEALSP